MNTNLSDTAISNNGHMTEVKKKKFFSYEKLGFRDAAKADGAVEAFGMSLERFFARLMRRAEKDSEFLQEKKQEAEGEAAKLEKQAELHDASVYTIKNESLPELEKQQNAVRSEIRDIKENPQKYIDEAKDPFKFWWYLTVLFFTMIFIHLFYSSVIYSAMFREVKVQKGTIFHSVFHPNVYHDAYINSTEALLAVIAGPFVFLLFATLMHHFKSLKSRTGAISFWGITVLTFFFDSLLAYQIAKRLYDAERQNAFDRIENFTVSMAAGDSNFWMVIFFGFIVYFVFGYMLGVFDEERSRKMKLDRMIRAREEKLEELSAKGEAYRGEIAEFEEKIRALKLQATELRKPSDKLFYSPHELKRIISDYAIGWIQYLRMGRYDRQDAATIQNTIYTFYQSKGIN
ncbi:MAG: hypothetical protein FMNOHCHN_00536 [Ignavibacteriaceae bacterium]|nr:hypothetical protein [Ignavibacteriaceae bacterium]